MMFLGANANYKRDEGDQAKLPPLPQKGKSLTFCTEYMPWN